MSELKEARESTIRKLFARSSNRCAFPSCKTAIVDLNTDTIVGDVCHIKAQSKQGPRFDPGQTSEERHSLQNLVLMCKVHHKMIDAKENVGDFSVEHLLELKKQHEARADGAPEPELTAEMVAALLETARVSAEPTVHMDFRGSSFNAGGHGGGPGGAGGGGGIMSFHGITPAGFQQKMELDGKPGDSPGGGGGGGGVLVLAGRTVSDEDCKQGLHISAFFFASAAQISGHLLFALGAGWESCTVTTVPLNVDLLVATIIETGTISPNTLLVLDIVAQDPSGNSATCGAFEVGVSGVMRPVMRQVLWQRIQVCVTQVGVWTFTVRSGDVELARTLLEFKVSS